MDGLVIIPLLLGVSDWYAVARRNHRLEYFFKPATLSAIIAWAFLIGQARPDGWGWSAPFFLAGLVFSLGGDVFLMLPDERRFFVPGLASFLLAQICYIAGFNPALPPLTALLLFVPLTAIAVVLFHNVALGLRRLGETQMLLPVALYSLVLSLTLFSGWATLFRPDWTVPGRLLATAGVTIFFTSDSMLAWDRFVKPWPRAHLSVMVTYHLAQLSLAGLLAWAP